MKFIEVINRDGVRCLINLEKITLISEVEGLGAEIFMGSEDHFVGTDIPLDDLIDKLKTLK